MGYAARPSIEEIVAKLAQKISEIDSKEEAAELLKRTLTSPSIVKDTVSEFVALQLVVLEKLTQEEVDNIKKNIAAGNIII